MILWDKCPNYLHCSITATLSLQNFLNVTSANLNEFCRQLVVTLVLLAMLETPLQLGDVIV